MSSKSKNARQDQKAQWEQKLAQRVSMLNEKGFERETIGKDASVRMLRAKLRETGFRLKAISELEKRIEELQKMKTEKANVPKERKGKKGKDVEQAPEASKRQQKKQKKKESKTSQEGEG
jgi:hypothetical protein